MIKEKKVRTKKVNSKSKGDRFERQVANLFKKHWGVTCYRTPGSGAYTSRSVGKALKEATVGDIVVEELPEIVFECKNYYSFHWSNWFSKKPPKDSIYSFWQKLADEASKFRKIPMLICKEYSSPIVCIVPFYFANQYFLHVGSCHQFFNVNRDNNCLTVFNINEILSLDLDTIKIIIKDMNNFKS